MEREPPWGQAWLWFLPADDGPGRVAEPLGSSVKRGGWSCLWRWLGAYLQLRKEAFAG